MSEAVYRRKEVFSTAVDDDVVLFDEAGGQYYTTSGVGAAIWERLSEPKTLSSLCDELMAEYEIDRATCERDVRAFLARLTDAGVVTSG